MEFSFVFCILYFVFCFLLVGATLSNPHIDIGYIVLFCWPCTCSLGKPLTDSHIKAVIYTSSLDPWCFLFSLFDPMLFHYYCCSHVWFCYFTCKSDIHVLFLST